MSGVESRAAKPARPFLAALADSARRLLGAEEPRVIGGLSHTRSSTPRPVAPVEPVIPVSTFKMVGLSEVQAKLAERWPALSEKVHLVARNTISRHLNRGDVFERQGDDGYLVLFSNLGAEEAEFKSRVIAKEIAEHLLGEGDALGIVLSAQCTTVLASALAAGDHEAVLAEALARAAPPRDQASFGPRASGEYAPRAVLPPHPADEAGGRKSLGRPTTDEAAENAHDPHAHIYSPVWDVTQMTLLRFRAPISETPGEGGDGYAAASDAFQADVVRIRTVNRDLSSLADRGRRLPVIIPVHHTSLGSGSQRNRLHQAFDEIPPALRKLITVEICFPREEFWSYACKAFMEMTRPLGMGWSALLDLESPDSIPPGGAWLRGVSTTVAGAMRAEADSLRLMTSFRRRARMLDLECAAYGLGSRALVLGAVGAGFRFLSGPAIHVDVSGLAKAVRFEPLDLYPDLIHRDPRADPTR